jgi:hypothetical protein
VIPVWILGIASLVLAVVVAVTGSWVMVVSVCAALEMMIYAVAGYVVWRLRRRSADAQRPFRLAGGRASALTASVVFGLLGLVSAVTVGRHTSVAPLAFLVVVAGLVSIYVFGYLPRMERKAAAELAARRVARAAARAAARGARDSSRNRLGHKAGDGDPGRVSAGDPDRRRQRAIAANVRRTARHRVLTWQQTDGEPPRLADSYPDRVPARRLELDHSGQPDLARLLSLRTDRPALADERAGNDAGRARPCRPGRCAARSAGEQCGSHAGGGDRRPCAFRPFPRHCLPPFRPSLPAATRYDQDLDVA